jgi:hypothetical protein
MHKKRRKGIGMKVQEMLARAELERKIKENLNKLTYRQLIHILSIIPDESREAGN